MKDPALTLTLVSISLLFNFKQYQYQYLSFPYLLFSKCVSKDKPDSVVINDTQRDWTVLNCSYFFTMNREDVLKIQTTIEQKK